MVLENASSHSPDPVPAAPSAEPLKTGRGREASSSPRSVAETLQEAARDETRRGSEDPDPRRAARLTQGEALPTPPTLDECRGFETRLTNHEALPLPPA